MERFNKKLKRGANGCVLWTGAVNQDGYGNVTRDGRTWKAHRLAWALKRGGIPKGLRVLHKCDNPGCVNVRHLFLGTQADNIRDCVAKGRYNRPVGNEHWQRKTPGRYRGVNNPNYRHGGYARGG